MKIVVLDSYTLNPVDLNWDELKTLGECRIYDRTSPELVLERSAGAEIILTNKTVLDRAKILNLPSLKYIGVTATGYNIVDINAADERKIPVTNVPEYGTNSVAQMTFALILELVQNVGHHSETVHSGRWVSSLDFCYWDKPLIELDGLTIGIVGYGRIGRKVAEIAKAFGMKVLVCDINILKTDENDIFSANIDEIFEKSDIISLHCPLTSENKGFVNNIMLSKMKKTAFFINTSRGPLVNEKDLADALNDSVIAGAALDVLSVEPPKADNPLLSAKNCIITPHIAWATLSARKRLMDTVVENVRAFLNGEPVNVVNLK
jgi:glycerate dehydrogenase